MKLFAIRLILTLPTLLTAVRAAQGADAWVMLPGEFIQNRIFVTTTTGTGDTLRWYTDTGGGTNMLAAEAAKRLALPVDVAVEDGDTTRTVQLFDSLVPAMPPSWLPDRRLFVMPPPSTGTATEGLLGRLWFARRVWLLDYRDHRLGFHDSLPCTPAQPHTIPLYFQVDSTGARTTHFPRVSITVEGDSLDLLFDTGAMWALTEWAQRELKTSATYEAASFIVRSQFDRWSAVHPDWMVIVDADRTRSSPAIRVPEVHIAGYTVGPVWFVARPDEAFHDYMSQWMDKPIEGALGGSALKYFTVELNYPCASATFSR